MLALPERCTSGEKFKFEASGSIFTECGGDKAMKRIWTDHLEMMTAELLESLHNFKREDPFYCYPETRSYLRDYIESYHRGKVNKSQEIAWDFLELGNSVSEQPHERIIFYTEAILYAPADSSALLTAYLKRSVLLLETGHLKECDNDSAMALDCFLNNLNKSQDEFKSIDLKTEVDKIDNVVEAILKKMEVPEEEYSFVEPKILSLVKGHFASGNLEVVVKSDECILPELKDGENANFPSASNAVQVEYSPEKGRHVVANRDISKGDVLFVEKAFSFVPQKPRCWYCCQRRYTYIPCTKCRDVQYCSKECRDKDWASSHEYECGFVDFLRQTGIGHLALKLILTAESDFENLKNLNRTLRERETRSNTVLSNLIYENVHNLKHHSDKILTADYRHFSLTALLISYYLTHYTNYVEDTEENVYLCSTILLRHMVQVLANSHGICASGIDIDGSCATLIDSDEQVGSAIHPSASMMNHSCEPSVFVIYRNSYLIARACKDIKKGEEVFNLYGAECRISSREERQKLLRTQYWFDCNCEACSEKYDRFEIKSSFQCAECKGPLVFESETGTSPSPGDRLCILCSRYQIIPKEPLNVETTIGYLMKNGDGNLNANRILDAQSFYLRGWKLSRRFLFVHHPILFKLAGKLALCFFRLHAYQDCMKVLSVTVTCVEICFTRYSAEMSKETKKLCEVFSHYCRNVRRTTSLFDPDVLTDEEKEYFEQFKDILRALHGNDHPFVSGDVEEEEEEAVAE